MFWKESEKPSTAPDWKGVHMRNDTPVDKRIFHPFLREEPESTVKDYSPGDNVLILAEDCIYDMDCKRTGLNNNVLVVGASGTGKSRSVVSPNILQAVGSYIISDPKGVLYKQYAEYLRSCGYVVKKLNIADPEDTESGSYNFFDYIYNEQDILTVAHMIINAGDSADKIHRQDPFWDDATELLLAALIGYLYYHTTPENRTLSSLLRLAEACDIQEEDDQHDTPLDLIFEEAGKYDPDDFSLRCYKRFRQAAGRTLKSILITLYAKIAVYDTPALRRMFSQDTVEIPSIGMWKTALFVIVSDTDRSMDRIANVFFSQAMHELCRTADNLPWQKLPMDVRFILDDFSTNIQISEFPRMISSIRSRGISAMLMIQDESQLTDAYGQGGRTIISNCDTYMYLGSNDIETARNVARRADESLRKILYMPVGSCWIFRRGQLPVKTKIIDPVKWKQAHGIILHQ